jgi:hypothetical protein
VLAAFFGLCLGLAIVGFACVRFVLANADAVQTAAGLLAGGSR